LIHGELVDVVLIGRNYGGKKNNRMIRTKSVGSRLC
jgi:hypothetical protein